MLITINNLKTYYEIHGQGQQIILLHGWGGKHDSWFPITQILRSEYQVITPDLPGFGRSELDQTVWDITAYTNWLKSFLHKLQINKPVIVGHSFGGTIAAKYTMLYPKEIHRLILVDAKLIKPKLNLKTTAYKLLAKTGKIFTSLLSNQRQKEIRARFYNKIDQHDYEQLEGVMKQNFLRIISEDLTRDLSEITTPTLIIWGKEDTDTPLSDACLVAKLIPESKLEILSGTHFAYLEQPEKVCEIVSTFIKTQER